MDIIQLFVQNREIATVLYSFLVFVSASVIAFIANKYYSISKYKGLKYFRNSFVSFGIAFLINFAANLANLFKIVFASNFVLNTVFQIMVTYFFSLSGFYLAFSLVWKTMEVCKDKNLDKSSSFLNCPNKEIVFHLIAMGISIVDIFNNTPYFLFASQIGVLMYAIPICYVNYKSAMQKVDKKKAHHQQIYLIVIIMFLIGYILNFLDIIISPIFPEFQFYVYLFTMMIFGLFLALILKVILCKRNTTAEIDVAMKKEWFR